MGGDEQDVVGALGERIFGSASASSDRAEYAGMRQ